MGFVALSHSLLAALIPPRRVQKRWTLTHTVSRKISPKQLPTPDSSVHSLSSIWGEFVTAFFWLVAASEKGSESQMYTHKIKLFHQLRLRIYGQTHCIWLTFFRCYIFIVADVFARWAPCALLRSLPLSIHLAGVKYVGHRNRNGFFCFSLYFCALCRYSVGARNLSAGVVVSQRFYWNRFNGENFARIVIAYSSHHSRAVMPSLTTFVLCVQSNVWNLNETYRLKSIWSKYPESQKEFVGLGTWITMAINRTDCAHLFYFVHQFFYCSSSGYALA